VLKTVAELALLVNAVACAQSVRSADMPREGVAVSRRALTISVPFDSSAARVDGGEPKVGWDLGIIRDVANHSSTLRLGFREPLAVAAYRVARHPESCRGLTDTYSCRDSATAQVENGRLVITIRDSAMLALLLAGRPNELSILSSLKSLTLGRATVRYGDPQLLPPSKEALAEYDRVLGREGWSPWTRTMWIANAADDSVWMQVGERRAAGVVETQGRPIDSMNRRSDFSVGGWTSSDSSVVGLAPSNEPQPAVTVVALRPGRSAITVHGLRGPSDELPRSPRARTLTRTVTVINRLTRVEISPRPAEIVVGSKFDLVARAIDENGAAVEGVPVDFYVIYDTPDQYGWEGRKYGHAADVELATPGRRRFIARFATFADTLDVRVVPRR
jgi:hypothetical protein